MRFFAASGAIAAACGFFAAGRAVGAAPQKGTRVCCLPAAGGTAGPCHYGRHPAADRAGAGRLCRPGSPPYRRGGARFRRLLPRRRERGALGGRGGRRGGTLPGGGGQPAQNSGGPAGAGPLCAGSAQRQRCAGPLRGRHRFAGRVCFQADPAGRERTVPRPDGPAPKAAERRPPQGDTAGARRGVGGHGAGGPQRVVPAAQRSVPGGRALPCAGGERDARLHPVRCGVRPPQKGTELCQPPPAGVVAGGAGAAAGGHHRLYAVGAAGGSRGLGGVAGRMGLRRAGRPHFAGGGGCGVDAGQRLRCL